jgi:sodium/bile acid cotransporter 2
MGVVFIVAAVVYGSITEASIWQAAPNSWALAVFLLPLGAGFGYTISYALKLPRRQCRTVALETGIQNTTLAIAILVLSFPANNDKELERQTAVLQFPLLFSLFLVIDSLLLTLFFFYISRFDPPEETLDSEAALKGGDDAGEGGEAEEGVGDDVSRSKSEQVVKDVELVVA